MDKKVPTLCIAGMAFAALMCLGPSRATGQSADELAQAWKRQDDEIVNGYIRVRAFRSGGLAKLTLAEVRDTIVRARLGNDPDGLRRVVPVLAGRAVDANPPWSVVELNFEGNKLKEATIGKDTYINIRDPGRASVDYSGSNRTAVIRKPGTPSEYVRGLADFRYVPKQPPTQVAVQMDRVRATAGDWDLLADRQTGHVQEAIRTWPDGSPSKAFLYDGFADFSGGIRFPRVAFQGDFEGDGKLTWCSLSVAEEMRFNTELPADTFSLKPPSGINVIDNRGDQPSSYLDIPKVNDVLDFVEQQHMNQPVVPTWWQRIRPLILIAAGVLTVLLIAGQLVRRRMSPRGAGGS